MKKALPLLTAKEEAQRQRLEEAIAKGQTLHIEMGHAWNEKMETVPWRGFIAPEASSNTPKGCAAS